VIFGSVTWFGAHINAPIIMIAEKAADFTRRREPLELVRLAGAAEWSRPLAEIARRAGADAARGS